MEMGEELMGESGRGPHCELGCMKVCGAPELEPEIHQLDRGTQCCEEASGWRLRTSLSKEGKDG